MKITIEVKTTREAFCAFLNDEHLKNEYSLKNTDDIFEMQEFLDNIAHDIRRLSEEECELLCLEWQEGFYISTWKSEYLHTENQ